MRLLYMTKGTVIKELFTKCILPLAYCGAIIFTFYSISTLDNVNILTYIIVAVAFGLPVGIRKMFIWLVPSFSNLGTGACIIILDFIIGGFIGVFMLVWFFIRGMWYIPLTIYRCFKV